MQNRSVIPIFITTSRDQIWYSNQTRGAA